MKKILNRSDFKNKYLLDSVLEIIISELEEHNICKISGFGTFKVRQKKERMGRNPKTKEEVLIAPRKTVSFCPSDVFRYVINGGREETLRFHSSSNMLFKKLLEKDYNYFYGKFYLLKKVFDDIILYLSIPPFSFDNYERYRIIFRKFGSFEVRKLSARYGRNPKTGEKKWLEEKTRPFFKVSPHLVRRLNKDVANE